MEKKKSSKQFKLSTQFERIDTHIYEDSKSASLVIAEEIANLINEKTANGGKCVLGLTTGRTMVSIYIELVELYRRDKLDFSNVISFNVDEFFPIKKEKSNSCASFMFDHLFDHINIKRENIHFLNGAIPLSKLPEHLSEYENKIIEAGGLDIQLLGLGRTGHIGFNEPGSQRKSITRLVTLDRLTRRDIAQDFRGSGKIPRQALTMGLETLLNARRIILMAWGENKSEIIRKTVEDRLSERLPASFLQEHSNCSFYIDSAAAAELTRIKTPWLLNPIKWDERLVRKAVVWLCQKLDKPILKLTERDYNDNGMSDLLSKYGPAYNINIKIFNDLQHTITGWPGGKPNADDSHRPERAEPAQKTCLIFSPHPDDDVISMGGTFIRLVEQKHQVNVAYQTSGSVAVSDDLARHFVDFADSFNDHFDIRENTGSKIQELEEFISRKKEDQIDIKELRSVKAIIRKTEAISACRYVGVPENNIHFLNMPFYDTGKATKKPLSRKDIDIVKNLLIKIKPHQIYAAGDLSDPHGTHRVCLNAIFMALDELKDQDWMKDCWIWLYRGAWHEWDIHEIEMAVPISPEELMKKRLAIFRHQSQKDGAMFLGEDNREFWQRAEERNRSTAKAYDSLGMAEYEAIEAFVRYNPQEKSILNKSV